VIRPSTADINSSTRSKVFRSTFALSRSSKAGYRTTALLGVPIHRIVPEEILKKQKERLMAIIRDWHCKQGEYPSLNDMLLDTIPVNLSHPFFRPKPVRGSFFRLLLPFPFSSFCSISPLVCNSLRAIWLAVKPRCL
jgi:hypothetical protein